MLAGLTLGVFIVFVIWIISESSYKRVLIMKANNHEAECVNGKFITIMHEDEYIEMKLKAMQYDSIKNGK